MGPRGRGRHPGRSLSALRVAAVKAPAAAACARWCPAPRTPADRGRCVGVVRPICRRFASFTSASHVRRGLSWLLEVKATGAVMSAYALTTRRASISWRVLTLASRWGAAERTGLGTDDGPRQCWATIRRGLSTGLLRPGDLAAAARRPVRRRRYARGGPAR